MEGNEVVGACTGFANSDDVLPVYIGDDRTDEDAFKVLYENKNKNHCFLMCMHICLICWVIQLSYTHRYCVRGDKDLASLCPSSPRTPTLPTHCKSPLRYAYICGAILFTLKDL